MTPEERRAQYMRVYRATNSAVRELNAKAGAARNAARSRLVERHPEEFAELLDEERRRRGLPPVGVKRPGPKPATRV